MKKFKWLFIISLMTILVCYSNLDVMATEAEIDTSVFKYGENEDGTITITRYNGEEESVVIPSEIDGKSVKAIKGNSFYECNTIKYLVISEGITDILDREFNWYDYETYGGCYGAFQLCRNLQTVSLPSTLETIGDDAFFDCYNLNVINIPEGVTSIGSSAFHGCDSIEKLIIPDSVTFIGEGAFFLSYDERIPIYGNPNSYIKSYVDTEDPEIKFSCIEHSNIVIDPAVAPTCTQDGKTAGSHCADCRTIISGCERIPKKHKIITVDKKATCTESSEHYTYCEVCGERDIDENENFVPPHTRTGATGHKFDNGVVTNNGTVTYTCIVCGETETITKTETRIYKGKKISDANNVYIVTNAGTENCTVQYTGIKSSKTTITIPDTVTIDGITYKVTSIAKNAFINNKKLKKVTIGSNITVIKANAFSGCKNLKTITIKSKNIKSVGKNAFKGIHKKAKIKVPASKLKKYKKLLAGKGQKSTIKITK